MSLDWLHWGKDDGVRKRRRRMSKRRGIKWKLADAALLAPCHAVQWVSWKIDWIFKMFPPLQWCISICIFLFQESTPRGTRLIRSTWSTPVARKSGSTRFTRHGQHGSEWSAQVWMTFFKRLVSEAGVNIRKCQRLPLTLVDDLGFLPDVLNWRWPHKHFMHASFGTLRRCHCTSKSPNSCWISSLLSKSPTSSWFKILRWDAADKSLLWYGFHTMPNLF